MFSIFFFTQELLPVDSELTVFKNAYFESNEIIEERKPLGIVLNNGLNQLNIQAGKNTFVPISVEGEGSFNRNLSFSTSSEDIVDVIYTGTESFCLVGKSMGKCIITFYSILDSSINATINVGVTGFSENNKPTSYNYYQTVNGIIEYNTSFYVDPRDSLKIGYVSKTSGGIFTKNSTSFDFDPKYVKIDDYGNVSFNYDSYGKSVGVDISADGETRVVFNINVRMPESYGPYLSKQMLSTFILYILLFAVLALLTSTATKSKIKRKYIVSIILFLLSIAILLIQRFALSRYFTLSYFFVSPVLSLLVSLLVFYNGKITAFVRRFFKNRTSWYN